MKRFKLLLATAVLVGIVPFGAAAEERVATGPELPKPPPGAADTNGTSAAKKPAAVLDELLELSGAKRAIGSLPGTIGQLVMKSEKLNDAMASALMEALSPRPFVEEVTKHLTRSFDAARAKPLLDWYRSPLGRKIVALTEATDKDPKGLKAKIKQLKRLPPPPERMVIFEKLVKSDDPVGLLTAAAQALFHGLVAFVSSVMPPDKAPPSHLLRRDVSSSQGSESFVPLYAAAYESLSNEELQKYLDFATSSEAVWFDKIERDAIEFAMRNAGERMGKAMIKFAIRIRGSL